MKIVIPVSRHDIHRLSPLIDSLIRFGGLESHSCLIFATPSAFDQAMEQSLRLSPHMAKVTTLAAAYEPEFGMPINANVMFYGVVMNLAKIGNKEPFLWLECDAEPRTENWLNLLENDYKIKGQPCYGNIVPLPFLVNDELVYRDKEEFMMGVGIYPAGMETDERIRPLIWDLGRPPAYNPKEEFDTYIRGGLKALGWANSDLIADMWNTEKYAVTSEGLTCKPVPTDRKVRQRGGKVPSSAVLIHGCKDDSLHKIVMGGKVTAVAPKPVVAPKPIQTVAPKPVEAPKPAPVETIVPEPPKVENVETFIDADGHKVDRAVPQLNAPSGKGLMHDLITAGIAKGSYRIHVLAKEIGTSNIPQVKKDVIALGFIVTPPGWIKAKA